MGIVITLIAVALTGTAFGAILRDVLVEASLAVSVFVTFTLVVLYSLERLFKFDFAAYSTKYPKRQIFLSAVLGALPGCGGAIIVITNYVAGHLRFGAMVTVLITTMGDAAFLLLAKDPYAAFVVMGVSFVAGLITGHIIDFIHKPDFLKAENKKHARKASFEPRENRDGLPGKTWVQRAAFVVFIPGFLTGMIMALQIDVPAAWEVGVGLLGAFLMLIVWLNLRDRNPLVNYATEIHDHKLIERSVDETAFILIWVILAFLSYEVAVVYMGLNIEAMFDTAKILVPLIAVLVGFIPGCGPQILVTTFYINGVLPMSAQMGNAISNDGDALFPALALAPRAAIIATLYSAVPALLVSYAFLFLFE